MSESRTIWWLHPGLAVSAITGLVAMAAYAIPESSYLEYWRMPRYFGGVPLQFALVSILAFLFGTVIGNTRPFGRQSIANEDWRNKIPWQAAFQLFRTGFFLCLTGYLIWIGSAIKLGLNVPILVKAITGQNNALETIKNHYLITLPGATSLVNFDVAVIVLGFLIGTAQGWRLVRKRCLAVFALAVLRAYLNMERLAVVELVVPFAVLFLRLVYLELPRTKATVQRLIRFAPVIAPSALFCFFTISEYTRSWTSFYSTKSMNLVEFSAVRLLGYYVTALNNGAYLLERLNVPLGAPVFTFDFLYKFPFLNDLVQSVFPSTLDSGAYISLLASGANPEFNNADGILLPIIDYGLAGGLLYWLLAGLVCGAVYQLFSRKHPVGLCLYPVLFVGILEIPRILFWSAGRIFPTWCLLIASCVIFVTSRPLETAWSSAEIDPQCA
ncbi:MAG: oligosaccharide repeat unit polymerase [Acidobacteriota bacterium]|nr:oligosaccharide repeat unit polymerase [Acidobacteriota bacterium]